MENYRHKLDEIIELARFAPSVHNIQPWSLRLNDDTIRITRSLDRSLGFGDQTGRQTWLSLGIFAEHCKLVAAELGLVASAAISDDCINVKISEGSPKEADVKLSQFIKKRHTDRSIFKPLKITDAQVQALRGSYMSKDVEILVRNDAIAIETVADLTKRGLSIALSAPPFRNELAEWVVPRGQKRLVGIPAESLQIGLLRERIEPWLLRSGIAKGFEIARESARWESAGGVIFICSRGDTKKYWAEAGMAYARVCLTATSLGLAQSTSASIVEASTFHEDVEQMLGTNLRLQSIVRLGKSDADRPILSRRLSADELL